MTEGRLNELMKQGQQHRMQRSGDSTKEKDKEPVEGWASLFDPDVLAKKESQISLEEVQEV